MGKGLKFFRSQHFFQFNFIKTEFTLLFGNMDLKQNRNDSVDFFSRFVNFLQEFERVHTMNQVDKGSDVFDLVALQMSDHVPAGIGRQPGLLGLDFLDFIFPKVPDSRGIGLTKIFNGLRFAHCDQLAVRVDKGSFDRLEIGLYAHVVNFALGGQTNIGQENLLLEMQAAILEGIGMGFLLSLMVGPVFFMLITTSMEQGFRYAAVLALGILISDLVYVLITYFGVSYLTQYPLIQQVLGYVGGGILIGFGISFWRKKVMDRPNSGGLITEKAKKRTAFAKGFGVNGVNPFVMLFWISIASLVSSKSDWGSADRFFYYFGLLLTVFGIDLGKAFVAGKLAHLMTARLRGFLNKGVGILICYFGLKMIWDTWSL